jgi:hypothetical protein
MYREADGPDGMRRAVREQVRAGADFVKIMTTGARSNEMEDPEPLQLTEEELSAVADEAHRMGYRLSAHAEGLAGCEAAVTHGADTIEHGISCAGGPICSMRWPRAARCSCRHCRVITGWPAWATPSTPPKRSACPRCRPSS